MKSSRRLFGIGILLVASTVAARPASAHHVWLNATRYTVEEAGRDSFGGKTTVYFGWGDFYPLHDFLRDGQLQRFVLRTPAGQIRDLAVAEHGFRATPVELPERGTYVVAASLRPGFVTDVLENGRITVLRKPKNEAPAGARILESKFGLQFAKAILNVGDAPSTEAGAAPTVGHDLEIVPLKNPLNLREGAYLPFSVVFRETPLRRPLAEPEIKATYLGFSTGKDVFAWSGELSTQGVAHLKLARYGVWQIFVVYSHEPPADMAGKADKVEYKASLTFELR